MYRQPNLVNELNNIRIREKTETDLVAVSQFKSTIVLLIIFFLPSKPIPYEINTDDSSTATSKYNITIWNN